ncbi:MAG: hypothetical protein HRT88_09565 [Lentisphaeraceae bacterium]|nr:hypothetical protein [Lentisphaeraceae bacterium]
MKISFVIVLLSSFMLLSSFAGEANTPEQNNLWAQALIYKERGIQAQIENKQDAYFKQMEEVIKKVNQKAPLYINLGILASSKKSTKNPVQYYQAALKKDPANTRALYLLAVCEKASAKTRYNACSKWAKVDPNNALPYYLVGMQYFKKKQYSNMVKWIEKGNDKSVRFPEYEWPQICSIRFPDTEYFRKSGVAGKEVPRAYLYLVTVGINRFATMLPKTDLLRASRDSARWAMTLKEKGNKSSAIRYLEAFAVMNLKLMQNKNKDQLYFMGASAAYRQEVARRKCRQNVT